MKTSTILILSAIAVVFISLTAFNFNLKASFAEGNYKNRFYGLEFIPIKNINEIDVMNGNRTSFTIEQGDREGIWVAKGDREEITWKQIGDTLQIGLSAKNDESRSYVYLNNMTVIVNKPNKISIHAGSNNNNEMQWNNGSITIKGLKQEQFDLHADNYTSVILTGSQLNQLKSTIGMKGPGASALELAKDNVIQSADFKVEGESALKLNSPRIIKTNYQLSDQATVTLNGKALKTLFE